jgi:hypothetical protein
MYRLLDRELSLRNLHRNFKFKCGLTRNGWGTGRVLHAMGKGDPMSRLGID